MTEQEYDDLIAPMLLEVLHKVKELGGSMVARVQWEDGAGTTQHVPDDADIGQKMTQLASHCGGNIDTFCMEAMKRFDCSQSLVLYHLTKDRP